MSYEIIKDFIPGLPQIPYRYGVGAFEGVVCHCTDSGSGNGSDTPKGERNFELSTFNSAFVHFFVGIEDGKPVIRQTADMNYKAYGAGPAANQRFVHVELCMYDDYNLFLAAYDAYVWLLGWILYQRKLGVSPASANGSGTLWGHFEVSKWLTGTNHDDPLDYLTGKGISWVDHFQFVADKYNEIAAPPIQPIKEVSRMEPWLQDAVIKTIQDLASKGRIASPDLWINKVKTNQPIDGLAILLFNNIINTDGSVKIK